MDSGHQNRTKKDIFCFLFFCIFRTPIQKLFVAWTGIDTKEIVYILFLRFSRRKRLCLKNVACKFGFVIPPPLNVGWGLYWIRFVASVGRSVRPSVSNGPFRNCQSWSFITVRGHFKSIRLGLYCQVTIWPRKHKRKTPSQAFTRSKHIYRFGRSLKFCGTVHSCPLYNSFTNGRISFKLEWHIHLN